MKRHLLLTLLISGLTGQVVQAGSGHFSEPFSVFETAVAAVEPAETPFFEEMKLIMATVWDLLPSDTSGRSQRKARDAEFYKKKFTVYPNDFLASEQSKLKTKFTPLVKELAIAELAEQTWGKEKQNLEKEKQDLENAVRGAEKAWHEQQQNLESKIADFQKSEKTWQEQQQSLQGKIADFQKAEQAWKSAEEKFTAAGREYKDVGDTISAVTRIQTALGECIERLRKTVEDKDATPAAEAALTEDVANAYTLYYRGLQMAHTLGASLGIELPSDNAYIDDIVAGQLMPRGYSLEDLQKTASNLAGESFGKLNAEISGFIAKLGKAEGVTPLVH